MNLLGLMVYEPWFLYSLISVVFQIFSRFTSDHSDLQIFEKGKRTTDKQETHSVDADKLLEHDLKKSLIGLAHTLFGAGMK